MSYQVFARKYRPRTFDDVLGQDHVVQTLRNAIEKDRLAHAYLFVGPRGTGKTSTARIFAKALNGPGGPKVDFDPDDPLCVEIAEGRSLDVLEIDGASNNGVEQVRELRETVKFAPSSGRFKIYYIDEVHMLTTAAFNALLKTLEEPPPHVKFIFATTEPNKILPTIISRCQRFDLRRIPTQIIADQLLKIADLEGVEMDQKAAFSIAKGADGGMRDAQSMLDQLVAFCGTSITEENVLSIFGFTSLETIADVTEGMLERRTADALELIHDQSEKGKDLTRFLGDLISWLRNLLVALVDPENEFGDMAPEISDRLRDQVQRTTPERLLKLIDHFAETETRMKWAPNKRLHLEIAIIKATQILTETTISDVIGLLSNAEEVAEGLPATAGVNAPAVKKNDLIAETVPAPKAETVAEPEPEPIEESVTEEPEPEPEPVFEAKAELEEPAAEPAPVSEAVDEAPTEVAKPEPIVFEEPEAEPEPPAEDPAPKPEAAEPPARPAPAATKDDLFAAPEAEPETPTKAAKKKPRSEAAPDSGGGEMSLFGDDFFLKEDKEQRVEEPEAQTEPVVAEETVEEAPPEVVPSELPHQPEANGSENTPLEPETPIVLEEPEPEAESPEVSQPIAEVTPVETEPVADASTEEPESTPSEPAPSEPEAQTAPPEPIPPSGSLHGEKLWNAVLGEIESRRPLISGWARMGVFREESRTQFTVGFAPGNIFARESLMRDKSRVFIEGLLREFSGSNLTLMCEVHADIPEVELPEFEDDDEPPLSEPPPDLADHSSQRAPEPEAEPETPEEPAEIPRPEPLADSQFKEDPLIKDALVIFEAELESEQK